MMLDSHIPMFSNSLSEMDENERMLLYWLKYYNQHVFSQDEADRPTDQILEYDALVDEWVKNKDFKDRNKERMGGRNSAHDMNEVIEFGA